jgi:hypothetical protein
MSDNIDYKKLCDDFERYINKTQSRFKKCIEVIKKKDEIDQFDRDMMVRFECYDCVKRIFELKKR